jgi:hypothetical protein
MENSFLYCHFLTEGSKGIIKTIKLKLQNLNLRVLDLKEKIRKELENRKENSISLLKFELSKTIQSKSLSDAILLTNFFENKDDIFCKVDLNIAPVKTIEKVNISQTKTLSTYSYYELNKNTIKVLVPLNDVQTIPKEDLKGTFTETSCEVKVLLNGINYYFGVPRLHCNIIPDSSVVTTSTDNIVFKLKKANESDNWASLFKMKFVGEKE